jgi:UDP-glucose 4-epimerase
VRALVTGANGFVGSALMRAAAIAGFEAAAVTRRDTDYSPRSVAALMDSSRADVVFHSAGSASVAASIADPASDFASSVTLTEQLLEGIRLSGCRPRIAVISSAAVYGNPVSLPVGEDAPVAPISPYGHHKAMCEQLLREYAVSYGMPGLALRAFSLFGAGQARLLAWEIYRQTKDSASVVLRGTGDEERDYLHVDDFAALAWRCASAAREPMTVLNLASGSSIRARDLAQKIGAALGVASRLRCENRPSAGDPAIWRADIRRLRGLLGELRLPPFEERLRQVVDEWAQ